MLQDKNIYEPHSFFKVGQDAKLARLTYEGQDVMVEVVLANDLAKSWPTTAVAAAGSSAPLPGRKSSRSRKGRSPITVSSHITLSELKMRIFQALDVHPANAKVGIRSPRIRSPPGEARGTQTEIASGPSLELTPAMPPIIRSTCAAPCSSATT